MSPQAILFIGLQASGKSSFYRDRFFSTHLRVNLDMLRTRRREGLIMEACLQAGQSFVVDNTNVTVADRARYIGPARRAGFQVEGYVFEPDVPGSLRRNRQRTGRARVPDAAIHATRARLQPPRSAEGFDRLYRVIVLPGGRCDVKGWTGE